MTRALNLGAEKFLRNIKANTCAVACLSIRIHRAAMPDIFQGLDRFFNDIAPRCSVDRGDKSNAAIGVLMRGVIGIGGDERVALHRIVA